MRENKKWIETKSGTSRLWICRPTDYLIKNCGDVQCVVQYGMFREMV